MFGMDKLTDCKAAKVLQAGIGGSDGGLGTCQYKLFHMP